MAAFAPNVGPYIRILDPGAGMGILAAALVDQWLRAENRPQAIHISAVENDRSLLPYLEQALALCQETCLANDIRFTYEVVCQDFIEVGVSLIRQQSQFSFFDGKTPDLRPNIVIANPPYRKISSQSQTRKQLRTIGVETSNLYTAFIAVALKLLDQDGHLIAITPRSFCNGPYFKAFRKFLFEHAAFKRIHIFNARNKAFSDDEVLQENIIFHLVKQTTHDSTVLISANEGPHDETLSLITMPHEVVISPFDPNKVVHIISDQIGQQVIQKINTLPNTLANLNISVSTGRVVDFRAARFLRKTTEKDTAPLIYPAHFDINSGRIAWPRRTIKKPEAIVRCQETEDLLVDNGVYVLTKRFTAKEERRRVVAIVHTPDYTTSHKVGFENHINYFHANGHPLSENLARGLATFLNSTLVDMYFRIFNGHTQVNATDLRLMKYPSMAQLEALGERTGDQVMSQARIDELVERNLLPVSEQLNPVAAATKNNEAISILKQLGLPRGQQNERSGLTLLALLDLKPGDTWAEARPSLIGITQMMNFFEAYYGKKYAPNTRETVRRFTVHQFIQAGIVVPNPDQVRPINSPNYVYQIEPSTLKLIREFGTESWDEHLQGYLSARNTLRERHAEEREMQRIPIKISDEQSVMLSPGGQNILIQRIIDEFCPRFTPGADLIYLGDTKEK